MKINRKKGIIILIMLFILIFISAFFTKKWLVSSTDSIYFSVIEDFDVQPLDNFLITDNSNYKHQIIYDLKNHKKMKLANNEYSMGTRDSNGNYWLISLARTSDRHPRLYIIDNNGAQIRSQEIFPKLPIFIKSYEDYVFLSVSVAQRAETFKPKGKIEVYNLEGNIIHEIYLDCYVMDMAFKDNTLFLASHDLKNNKAKLLIYDFAKGKLKEIEGLAEHTSRSVLVVDDKVFWTNSRRRIDSTIALYNLSDETIKHITVNINPNSLYYNEKENILLVSHRERMTEGHTISKICLEEYEVNKFEVPSHNEVIFSEKYIYLIIWEENSMKKLDYNFNFMESIKLKDDATIIFPGR